MTMPTGKAPPFFFRSAPRPGRTCSSARCSPSNCSARPRSLRTIPIIAKDRAMRGLIAVTAVSLFTAASAAPAPNPMEDELRQARTEQAAAEAEVAKLDQAALQARDEASRLRAQQDAAAAAQRGGGRTDKHRG